MVKLPGITHYEIYSTERKRTITLAIEWFDRYLKQTAAAKKGKEPERGECSPPPEPPKGEEDKDGSGEGTRGQDASARRN